MCFDLVDQVLREYLDSEMVGWTGPQFAHNAPRGKPIPSCYEIKRIMAKCIISLNLYVVIFAVYIDPNCNGWNINQIVFQKDSFHKKEIYFLFTVHIFTNIMWKMCHLWTFIESSTILHIVMGHYKPTQHIYIKHSHGRCFFCLFREERAVFVSFLGKMKRNRVLIETSWIYFLHAPHVDDRESRDRIISWEIQYLISTWIPRYTDPHV